MCIRDSFDTPAIAPTVKKAGAYYLELFHGPTIAFKDMALSILPHLMVTAAKKNNCDKEIVILTATSGDTGKAAMAGFADVPGTRIVVFYPKGGVSAVQEKQMVTQKGKNVKVVGIHGNFDDAQSRVKAVSYTHLAYSIKHKENDVYMKRLLVYSKDYCGQITIAAISSVTASIATVFIIDILRQIIECISIGNLMQEVQNIILKMLIVIGVGIASNYMRCV